VRPTLEEIGSRFNLGPEETGQALRELLSSKVLYENGAPEIHSFHPNPASLWELPQRG
jgi:hypothetical protein